MNLVTDPWLPVTSSEKELCYISLQQLFEQPDEWLDLVLRSHERVSVMRLLICIVQAALDGPEEDEWDEALNEIQEAGLKYLAKWQGSFNLFDEEKPFLQISNLLPGNKDGSMAPIAKLDSTLAVGVNDSTLFDHKASSEIENTSVERKLLNNKLVISLVTFLNYSPSGRQSSALFHNKKIDVSAADAPCVNQNMLHTFVVKSTLISTIHANLIDKELCDEFYGSNSWGRPVWEFGEPTSSDDNASYQNSVNTYLGRLVPLSRFCKLIENSAYFIYCKGFQYSTKPKKSTDSKRVYRDFQPEPSSTIYINSKDEYLLLKSGINNPWKEVLALTSVRTKGSNGGALSLRYLSQQDSADLLVVGQVRGSKPGIILDLIESKIHIPSHFSSSSYKQSAYKNEVKKSEIKASILNKSIQTYLSYLLPNMVEIVKKGINEAELTNKEKKLTRKESEKYRAIRDRTKEKYIIHYWTLIEKQRHQLMLYISLLGTEQDQEREDAKKAWSNAINYAARETYETLCPQESPRQIRAYVAGWQILNSFNSKHQEVA